MAGGHELHFHNTDMIKMRQIVRNFVGERLRRNHIYVPGYDEAEDLEISDIAATLRRVGDELEAADALFFANMCNQLNITSDTAYPMFKGIADEIFTTGKNWGRIVAFLTFGSTLAIHCARREDMGLDFVDRIVEWISNYMMANLNNWMKENGDWDGFLDFFEPNRRDTSQSNGFLFSALAGVGIGALVMMSLK